MRRSVCGCFDMCRHGCFLLRLPPAEGRAFQWPPLSPCRWPGSRSTDSIITTAISEKYLRVYSMSPESERLRKVALNTYMPAGLADSADGETVCSRSGVWPSAWPCMSVGLSSRSVRGSRWAEKSPVGDSQDRSPLLAYSSSIWVVVRLRAWGTRLVWLNIQLTPTGQWTSW